MKIFPILSLAICVLCSACGRGKSATANTQDERIQVAVTISPTAELVHAIADTLCSTFTLLPDGSAPESYEPSSHDLKSLARANAYMYIGALGFEQSWMSRIEQLNPHLVLVNLAQSLDHEHMHGEGHGHMHDHSDCIHDPHYWTSIRGIRSMAKGIYEALCRIDSPRLEQYTKGYAQLVDEIDALEQEVRACIQHPRSRAFVIYHPSLTEFASEFGFRQLVIEEDGKEPSAQHLTHLISEAKRERVEVVFIQQEFDQRLARSIAMEIGAKVVSIHPLGGDWKQEIRCIAKALGGDYGAEE